MVKVKPDRTDLVDTRIIDGIPYLTIRIEDMVEVNGIPVNFPGVPVTRADDGDGAAEENIETE